MQHMFSIGRRPCHKFARSQRHGVTVTQETFSHASALQAYTNEPHAHARQALPPATHSGSPSRPFTSKAHKLQHSQKAVVHLTAMLTSAIRKASMVRSSHTIQRAVQDGPKPAAEEVAGSANIPVAT